MPVFAWDSPNQAWLPREFCLQMRQIKRICVAIKHNYLPIYSINKTG